jgi:hypothetical protein
MRRLVFDSGNRLEAPSMTEDDVRATAERLVQFHERRRPRLGLP